MTGAGATTTGAGSGATTTGGGTTQNPGPHHPRGHQAKLGETETNSSPTARTPTIAVFFIVRTVSLDNGATDLIRRLLE